MYEIPKLQVPVTLYLANDESIPGRIYITDDLVSPEGNPQIEEFLNDDPDDFFSFQSDAGAYRLINRRHIIYVETDQDDSEVIARTLLEPRSLVLHFTNQTTIYGLVYPTLAEETRASDLLNQEGDFFSVFRQGSKIIVNRTQIVYANAN